MAIERATDGSFNVYCDTCDDFSPYDVDGDWTFLMDEMKQDRWKSEKVNGEWVHTCWDCRSIEKEDQWN